VLSRDGSILVAGAGGFIGGHLVKYLLDSGFTTVRAVDKKPLRDWYQVHSDASSLQRDLSIQQDATEAVSDCRYVVNLAADMGGMGFIENNKGL
jgi:GDP-D-mannose 3',5'-epimerase